jgi:polysaccharide chain length determinant protein (PEP-CTERM system associated)
MLVGLSRLSEKSDTARRRWFIIISFSVSMIIGIYLTFTLPKIYSASTLILVEPQRVPSNYVRSIVTSDIDSRISTISQQIMSRTNLEKIVNEFKLFSGLENKNMFLEEKIESVRERISVKVIRARHGADAFTVAFMGEDPRVAMNVANALATYFIDENLKVREEQAVGTSNFLENERRGMLKRLEEVEKTLKNYRTKYMGELPEQLDSNLSILARLQEQLGLLQKRKSDAETRLILFESEAAELHSLLTVPEIAAQSGRKVQPESNEVEKLNHLKAQLTELQTKYTDQHPDVIRLKRLTTELEAQLAEKPDEQVQPAEPSVSQPVVPPAQKTAQGRQIAAVKKEIKELEKEISGIRTKIKIYQNRVEVTPKREQELMSLKRDYGNILSSYNSLINRKLEAEIAVNMEKRQKGERFRIVDPAVMPQKPISPNMKKLFLLIIGAGVGIGCGLILLLDYLDASFKGIEDIESLIGVPVIVTLPLIINPKAKTRRIAYDILSIFSIIISLGLFAGFAVLTFAGIERTNKLLNKLLMVVG